MNKAKFVAVICLFVLITLQLRTYASQTKKPVICTSWLEQREHLSTSNSYPSQYYHVHSPRYTYCSLTDNIGSDKHKTDIMKI